MWVSHRVVIYRVSEWVSGSQFTLWAGDFFLGAKRKEAWICAPRVSPLRSEPDEYALFRQCFYWGHLDGAADIASKLPWLVPQSDSIEISVFPHHLKGLGNAVLT